ncbi:hypothetical protein ELS19_11030 [Halogeometricum borinquense]|uniref:DUF4097 domain-containing protein n=1 Tax=Halogeometricum borinquense TaxID=60847 RepID=A0A482TNE5_9EURY|nr:DUF4097 family beta strand repeat-containing protein [Halogeometricum borinquense]RYJ14435.1 hypothetical protein ELS19_11030 [Halogeometricum borinquense]
MDDATTDVSRSPSLRRRAFLSAAAIGIGGLSGCTGKVRPFVGKRDTDEKTLTDVQSVVVAADVGNVTVTPNDDLSERTVRAHVEKKSSSILSSLSAVAFSATAEEGRATVRTQTEDGIRLWSLPTVQLRVEAHPSIVVESARVENGDVLVEDLVGPGSRSDSDSSESLVVRTEDGDATARETTGNVVVRTKDGDATARKTTGDADVRTEDGDAMAHETTGNVVVRTKDGDATARKTTGDADVRTKDGDATARKTTGDADVRTEDGDATAIGVKGFVRVHTTDGDARTESCDGILGVSSKNGDVDAEVSALRSDTRIETENGDARASLGESLNARVVGKTAHGDVSVSATLDDSEVSDEHVSGTVGDGGPTLHVQSENGDVKIS